MGLSSLLDTVNMRLSPEQTEAALHRADYDGEVTHKDIHMQCIPMQDQGITLLEISQDENIPFAI